MVLGIGNDITEVARIGRLYEKNGITFLFTILSQDEIAMVERRNGKGRAEFIAGRWAAKEALGKALGTGLGGNCSPSEITIRNNDSGAPEVYAVGRTAAFLAEQGVGKIWLSISHEKEYAIATVLLESLEKQ